ncbi:MAG TPA: hypothetical protein PK245_05240, partial [Clostridia bacterium]|nr:hypothetical protein [Clostridia bacterium]
MWTSVISIDKSLKAELDFLVSKLSKIKNLSFAVEESDDRTFVHIAALCDYADAVSREINAILVELYLCRMKLSYFLKRLRYKSFGYALAALVSSLTHFDREFEEAV